MFQNQNKFNKTIQLLSKLPAMQTMYIGYLNKFNTQLLRDSAQIVLSENQDPFVNFLPIGAEKEIRNRLHPYRKDPLPEMVDQSTKLKNLWAVCILQKF